jgi:hypothetical protein
MSSARLVRWFGAFGSESPAEIETTHRVRQQLRNRRTRDFRARRRVTALGDALVSMRAQANSCGVSGRVRQ